MMAAQNIATDPAAVKEAYARILEHQGEWTADRAAALALRRSVFMPERDAATVYMSATTSVARSGLRCLLTQQGETASQP